MLKRGKILYFYNCIMYFSNYLYFHFVLLISYGKNLLKINFFLRFLICLSKHFFLLQETRLLDVDVIVKTLSFRKKKSSF